MNIEIENAIIKGCREYKYLESYISENWSTDRDVNNGITYGRNVIRKLSIILQSRNIKTKSKTNLYGATVEPVITYGAENCQLASSARERLRTVEMDLLTHASRTTRSVHIRNEVTKVRTKVEEIAGDKINYKKKIWIAVGGQRECCNALVHWKIRESEVDHENFRKRGTKKATRIRNMNGECCQSIEVWSLICGKLCDYDFESRFLLVRRVYKFFRKYNALIIPYGEVKHGSLHARAVLNQNLKGWYKLFLRISVF